MLEWIGNHSAFVSALTSLIAAGIWAAYLQLFYFSYRRQRRPMIIVNRALGIGRDGHCLISNMGAAPVYILSILAVLEQDGESWLCTVTDDEDLSEGSGSKPRTHQGPLQSGGFMDVGPFDEMIRRVRTVDGAPAGGDCADGKPPFAAIEIKVIALYASSSRFVGATRRFEPSGAEKSDLRPTTLETKQLAGLTARKQLKQLLREHL